jgi:hypothetical protein
MPTLNLSHVTPEAHTGQLVRQAYLQKLADPAPFSAEVTRARQVLTDAPQVRVPGVPRTPHKLHPSREKAYALWNYALSHLGDRATYTQTYDFLNELLASPDCPECLDGYKLPSRKSWKTYVTDAKRALQQTADASKAIQINLAKSVVPQNRIEPRKEPEAKKLSSQERRLWDIQRFTELVAKLASNSAPALVKKLWDRVIAILEKLSRHENAARLKKNGLPEASDRKRCILNELGDLAEDLQRQNGML